MSLLRGWFVTHTEWPSGCVSRDGTAATACLHFICAVKHLFYAKTNNLAAPIAITMSRALQRAVASTRRINIGPAILIRCKRMAYSSEATLSSLPRLNYAYNNQNSMGVRGFTRSLHHFTPITSVTVNLNTNLTNLTSGCHPSPFPPPPPSVTTLSL
jgi:hypothetical protein